MIKSKGDRIVKSDSARQKRKATKRIKETVLQNYYNKLRNKRKKLNKLKNKHHDSKI